MPGVLRKTLRYVTDSDYRYLINASRGFYNSVPDDKYLKRKYRVRMHKELDLDNPRTFNEKLQWLKIHDRNPLYTTLVDKLAVKDWVAERIGKRYVTPTFAVWEDVDDIDIEALPDRFVLKTNHDCGGIAICRDKAEFDLVAAKRMLRKHMKRNYYWGGREWPYKDVVPRVFAEQYLDCDGDVGMVDYKFMCFGGQALCAFTCTGREAGDLRVDFFDSDWNHMPFTRHYPNAEMVPAAPANLRELQEKAMVLAEGIPFVRVDFYEVGGCGYFGEMTFYPGGGFEEFDPHEYDELLGSWIDLTLL